VVTKLLKFAGTTTASTLKELYRGLYARQLARVAADFIIYKM